ncbi:MAG: carboxypeptidase-like regulatory domain-containing protein [Planctomycetota bacterium]
MRRLQAIAVLTCAAACATPGDVAQLVPYGDQAAAPVQVPTAPGIGAARGDAVPAGGTIGRDAALADTFTAEGQAVEYRFDSGAGELSIFELEAWGLSRGWSSVAGVQVLAGDGSVLREVERPGGTRYTCVVDFVAPQDGEYRLRIEAIREHYRYTLIRHSGLVRPAEGARLALGQHELVYGFLADAEDRARFALPLAAGERVLLRVAPLRENHEEDLHKKRGGQLTTFVTRGETPGLPDVDGLIDGLRARIRERGNTPSYPFFGLAAGASPYGADRPLVVLQADEAGDYPVDVVARDDSEPGIFRLTIERSPELGRVRGRVGDIDDEPLAGVRVQLLLEPDLVLVAETDSDAEGLFASDVPVGDYTVLFAVDEASPAARARTHVADETELNLIYGE